MFYGMPGSGKSKTIESLLFASNNEKNKQDSVLIELIPYDIELANNFSNLMSLSQKYNVAYFRENNLSDLESRLAKFDSKTRIFVETPYENLNLHQDVPVAIHGREIKQFLCLAADSSPNILNNFVATAPELLQSILMTRMDLVADINDLLPALAEFSASIRGVYNEGRKKPLASVDLCPESIVEKEQLSPPA